VTTTINSRRNALVAEFRAAAGRRPADGSALPLLLDGEHLITEADAAGLPLRQIAVTPARLESSVAIATLVRRLERQGVTLATVAESVMAAMSPVRAPSGLVALADPPRTGLVPALAAAVPLVVVAIDVQDPGNLGALVRASEAAGATGLVTSGHSADPLGWKALRGSMGSAFRLPMAIGVGTDDLFTALRQRDIRALAMMPAGGRPLYETPLDGPLAILVGSEGAGLDPALASRADVTVTIPMKPPVESLNVAVAGALVLFESARQRAQRSS
jgi:RNA methyltransferase, TrmH family